MLTLDGQTIGTNYTGTTKSGTVTASVPSPSFGIHTLVLTVTDTLGKISSTTWTVKYKDPEPPTISNPAPVIAVWNNSTNTFTAEATDVSTAIDGSSVKFKLDSGAYQTGSYNAATNKISYSMSAAGITVGTHTAEFRVKDISGNETALTWTFTRKYIDESTRNPVPNGITSTPTPTISVKAASHIGDGSYWDETLQRYIEYRTAISIDSNWQNTAYDPVSGWISCTPGAPLSNGTHTVTASVIKDFRVPDCCSDGWIDSSTTLESTTWTITVQDITGPTITSPAPANTSLRYDNPVVSANVSDPSGIDTASINLKVNGSKVTHTYQTSSPTSGSVKYTPSAPLPAGVNNIELTVKDKQGNVSTLAWTFTIDTTFASSAVNLRGGFADWGRREIDTTYKYVEVTGPNNITTVYDGTTTPAPAIDFYPAYDAAGTYSSPVESITLPLTNVGAYHVTMKLKDINGEIGTSTWSVFVHLRPTIDQQNPAPGAGIKVAPSAISARVTDADGIDANSIKLIVAGVTRNHTYDPITGIVSWTPETPLPQSTSWYSVKLEAKDTLGALTTSTWSFAYFSGPQVTGYSPQSECYTNNPTISASFSDPTSFISGEIKVDGQSIGGNISYFFTGEYQYGDDCCSMVPVFDYTKATVSAVASGLADGVHNVEAKITDALGISSTVNWSFNHKVYPTFSNYPADDSITTNNKFFTVKVADPNGQINPNSILAYGNGYVIPTTYDPATGLITARPTVPFIEGFNRFSVYASDMAGNQGFIHFDVTVITDPPQFHFDGEGKTFYPGEPLDLKVDMKSFRTHIVRDTCSLKIDGNPVEAIISVENKDNRAASVFGGYAYCANEFKTAVGYLRYQGNHPLSPGTHELTATATDGYGNTNTQTWQFKVEQTVISDVKPQGIIVDPNPTIEATINASEVGKNKTTIKLVVDKVTVQPQITEENGLLKVTYTSQDLADGEYHNVTLSVNDVNHFRHTKTWKFCASSQPYPSGLSKPIPAQGAVNNGGINPISVIANNANGTMDLANARMTFTHLTTGKTYQGVVDVYGLPPVQKITGWYIDPAAFYADEDRFIHLDWGHKPGLDTPLEEGNWRVTATVPNKSNSNAPYTLTWDFTVGSAPPANQASTPGIDYAKPSGTTVSKKPAITVGFTKGTTLDSTTKWVELFVDGQKIAENVVTSTTPYQDGLANIYTVPAGDPPSQDTPSVVYKPTTDLAEGNHTVLARYYNVATGETITSKEWTFKVETTGLGPTDGVMDIATAAGANNACTGCHGTVEKRGIWNFVHPLILETNWTDSGCLSCHEHLTDWDTQGTEYEGLKYMDPNRSFVYQSHPETRVDCTRCHGQTGAEINHSVMGTHPSGGNCGLCHKSDGTLVMIPDIMNDSAMNKCTSCHNNVSPVNVTTNHNGAPEFNVSSLVSHNMDDGHLSDTKGCTSCHSRVLTKEHARTGRTDKTGQAITCNTCHDPSYKNEKLTLSGVSATLTNKTQVVQKIYYPPKGKRITSFRTSLSAGGHIWGVYALIDGQWVTANSYTMGYDNKVDGADALMIYGQSSRPGNRSYSLTLATPITMSLTEVTLTTAESDKMWDSIVNGKSGCMDCHTGAHIGDHTSNPDAFCLSCHKNNLVDEHINNAKTQDTQLTCDTCHGSADATVKNAITNHQRGCQSCHGVVDHDKQHEFNLGPECQTCHQLALTKEHMNNAKTQTKTLDCATCHNSTGNKIVRSIQNNSLYCGGCHQNALDADGTGHNVTFADRVPGDIPLYEGFTWSTPDEAAIYAGDYLPAGYELGQVVLSNRRSVDANTVLNFYETELTAKEWTMKSKDIAEDSNYGTAEFENEGRYAMVKCFKTKHDDGTGPLVEAGYKIEIWYTHAKPN